ncbi:MAG: GspH/FimT family pseudopilin [Agarilytica sp.]
MFKQVGFTLIELMVTLAVASIFVTLAVPSFQSSIENNRILTLNDKISATLQLARSEAIARSRSITICFSNDQTTCSGTWSDGWIVFVDEDSDRVFDNGTDVLLKANDSKNNTYQVSLISDEVNSFQFNNEGRAVERGTYQVCGPSAENDRAKGIVIQLSGGSRYAADTDADGVKETHDGVNLSC